MTIETFGTPDGQRGLINPALEVAVITTPQTSKTFNVPPNADSLLILGAVSFVAYNLNMAGVTTGINYPILQWGNYRVVPIATAIDTEYTFTSNIPFSSTVYILALTNHQVISTLGTKLLTTVSQLGFSQDTGDLVGGTNNNEDYAWFMGSNGAGATIPSAPGLGSSDHPISEIKWVSWQLSSTQTLLAAPGSGKRYRVMYSKMWNGLASGAAVQEVSCTVGGGTAYINFSLPQAVTDIFSPGYTGLACDANTAVGVNLSQATAGLIGYTVETV